MYALLEMQNSEQDENFVWLQSRAMGEEGNEGSAVIMNMERGKISLVVRGRKDGTRLMEVSTCWET